MFVRANEQRMGTRKKTTTRRWDGYEEGELTGSQQVTDRRALLLLFPAPLASPLVFPIVSTPLPENALPRFVACSISPSSFSRLCDFRGVCCWSSLVLFPCLHAFLAASDDHRRISIRTARHFLAGCRGWFFSIAESERKNAGMNEFYGESFSSSFRLFVF